MKVQAIKHINHACSTAYIINKNTDISGIISGQELQFAASRISHDKEFIHLNLYDRQLYFIVVPQKKEEWQTKEQLRRKGAELLHSLNSFKVEEITIGDLTGNETYTLATVEGLYLASYQFLTYFKEPAKKMHSLCSTNVVSTVSNEVLTERSNLWQSVFLTKTLVNEPVMSLDSTGFVKEVQCQCQQRGISAHIFDKQWLTEQGMGGILAINKGSISPAYLCQLEWKPQGARNSKPVVLVGKGIMFDTGGLSLKTSQYMETMKADMSGASAVLGTITALASNKIPLHVIALLPVTDNRPGENACAPGDIVKMHNGLHVEVLNTDAEGRMILADALSWAKNFDPELVIDIATLTGAANAAVGDQAAVTMGTAPDSYFDAIIGKGFSEHERLVRFPLWDDYADLIKSDIADLKNVGGPLAGAITAGKFLENFTSYPWIHLDIAGSAYHPKGGDYRGKGATGIGVRLLYEFLKGYLE